MNNENNPVLSLQEKYFLDTFPLIKKLVWYKQALIPPRAIEDFLQQVKYKLWRWQQKLPPDKELSFEEWQKLANTATNNEIKDYVRKKENQNVLFSEIAIESSFFSQPAFQQASMEGETDYELASRLLLIWRKYLQLSQRQKAAFLLLNENFVEYLLKYRCCTPKEIADSLELEENELIELIDKLPLDEAEVVKLLANKRGESLTVGQVRTARSKAKANLQKNLKG